MDTSPEFILQCEKAEEIQAGHKSYCDGWKDGDFYYWSVDDRIKVAYTESFDDYIVQHPEQWDFLRGRRVIWLPRQDQLQEMVICHGASDRGALVIDIVRCFYKWITHTPYNAGLAYSLEELWLAFVMQEKFKKKWTGEEWK
ncbi:hypothetical protein LCGC14_1634280 [marine sediment metagenome]|uniref:Uncharacterized protein n=1 Tax=marine sediment metagenome TaxID=412755 RepID=A0A0F9INZ2_9ZZZZ